MSATFGRGFFMGGASTAILYSLYVHFKTPTLAAFTKTANETSHEEARLDFGDFPILKKSSAHGDADVVRQRGTEILKYGIPDRGPVANFYANHVLQYDWSKRTPVWVAEHLMNIHTQGVANRRNAYFKPDPSVPVRFSAKNEDYKGSGWSRGHMAPAADNKHEQLAMDETFYLSNIVPQDIDNNSGFWNRLEIFCRDLTNKYKDVRVISGPLWLANSDHKLEKKIVCYQVIGNQEVAVPTHLYKLVLAEASDGKTKAVGAFIVPNESIPSGRQLTDYQVSLEYLEKVSGIIFHPRLPRKELINLCEVTSCKLKEERDLKRFYVMKDLESAKSLSTLEAAWKEAEKYKLKSDKGLADIYNKKKQALQRMGDF